mgnify:CR=1 FL=1
MGDLYYQGHVHKDAGSAPCPTKGWEKSTVATFLNGKPAYWQNGRIYVLDEKTAKETQYNKWAHKR